MKARLKKGRLIVGLVALIIFPLIWSGLQLRVWENLANCPAITGQLRGFVRTRNCKPPYCTRSRAQGQGQLTYIRRRNNKIPKPRRHSIDFPI